MLTKDLIYKQFSNLGINQGGDLYLDQPHSLQFIETCRRNGLAVIGIEAFTNREGSLTPQMDRIADFSTLKAESWDQFCEKCYEASLSFLQKMNPIQNIVINFTVLEKKD